MVEKRYKVNELEGYGSTEGYQFYPPCCNEDITHPIFLSSIVKEGECWHCGAKIDVELNIKE